MTVEQRIMALFLFDLIAFHFGYEFEGVRQFSPLAVELVDLHFTVQLVQMLIPTQ